MKTSKEMQLKILDKMRENVESGNELFGGIQFLHTSSNKFYDLESLNAMDFDRFELRIKPQTITITINGVEIPRPLTREEFKVRSGDDAMVYYPKPHSHLYGSMYAALHDFKEGDIFYGIPSIAIEASKALFGLKD